MSHVKQEVFAVCGFILRNGAMLTSSILFWDCSGIDFEGSTVGLAFVGTMCSGHSVGVVQVSRTNHSPLHTLTEDPSSLFCHG